MGYPPQLDLRCPDGNSDNPALDVLERAANESGSPRVQRVLDRARGDVDRQLHPTICETALQYRRKRRNYIQRCNAWLSGEWAGRGTIAEVEALD